MPGTEGYTKAAQKQKFVRHRDIKLKEAEKKTEARIQKGMAEGVCKRCREKVQWRFQYDKYKPLKQPGTCQQCRQKCITKAYRTLCDPCAKARGVCSGCCGGFGEGGAGEADAQAPAAPSSSSSSSSISQSAMKGHEESIGSVEKAHGSAMRAGTDSDDEAQEDDNDDNDNDNDDDDNDGTNDKAREDCESAQTEPQNSGLRGGSANGEIEGQWDARKYESFASAKYSKSRVVGSESDKDIQGAHI
jgi:hypothetical protein